MSIIELEDTCNVHARRLVATVATLVFSIIQSIINEKFLFAGECDALFATKRPFSCRMEVSKVANWVKIFIKADVAPNTLLNLFASMYKDTTGDCGRHYCIEESTLSKYHTRPMIWSR